MARGRGDRWRRGNGGGEACSAGEEGWLGTEESNPYIQIQNLLSYH